MNQPPLRLTDIPPLPRDVSWFHVGSLDLRATVHLGKELLDEYAQLLGPEVQMQWQMARQIIATQDVSTFDKILDCVGPSFCIYNDSKQEVLGWGPSAVAISVEDPNLLSQLINAWRDKVNDNPSELFRVVTQDWQGCPMYGIVAPQGVLTPTFAVCDGWLVAGIQPQTVKAFILRSRGKLPRWNVDQIDPAIRAELPAGFTEFSYVDPAPSVRFLVSLVPWMIDATRYGLSAMADAELQWQVPITSLDIPPAEMVTARLFPNITVTTYQDGRRESRDLFSTRVGGVTTFLAGYYALGMLSLLE